jgi:DNA-binding transcriptional regulator YhcF (GntR family)
METQYETFSLSTTFRGGDKRLNVSTKRTLIAEDLRQDIYDGKWKTGERLPSVNHLISRYNVARLTICRSLKLLEKEGLINSRNRVGYFVNCENEVGCQRVMLLMTSFDRYLEVLYREIEASLNPEKYILDIYFHHCNPSMFASILKEHSRRYRLFIVIPFDHPQVRSALEALPHHRLLQIARPPVVSGTSYISQDFQEEVLSVLLQLRERIVRYNHFTMLFPDQPVPPDTIKSAFTTFCHEVGIACSIERRLRKDMVQQGAAFFTFADNDLIKVIEWTEEKGLKLGTDTGLISYNDTPMKKIIRNGITVVSPDFREMGREISRFIETRHAVTKIIPTELTLRNSI